MKRLYHLARSEVAHGLDSRAGYLLMIFFAVSTAIPIFWSRTASNVFLSGVADLSAFFGLLPYAFLALAPAAAMGVWSEERRSGTLEQILSRPLPEWQLVVGKFFGAYTLLVFALVATAMVPILVAYLGNVDLGPLMGGYLGALLLAAACLAVAMVAGYLFRNPVSAYVAGVAPLALLMTIAPAALNFHTRFASIARGLLQLGDLTFYGIVTLILLTVNTWLVRRWR